MKFLVKLGFDRENCVCNGFDVILKVLVIVPLGAGFDLVHHFPKLLSLALDSFYTSHEYDLPIELLPIIINLISYYS